MNPMIRIFRTSILAALAGALLLGAAGCAEMQNLRANSEAQTRRIDELQKAQRKTAATHADELRRMQADVDKAKEQMALAKSDLRKAQTLRTENELSLDRTNQQASKDLQAKTTDVERLSKVVEQNVTAAETEKKEQQAKAKEKSDALAKAEADLKTLKAENAALTENLAAAKKTGDEASDLKKKLADAQKSADKGDGDSDADLEEAFTNLKASMKPLVDADLAFVTRGTRGVVVGLKADYVFESGSTAVSDQCHVTLDKIAEIFAKYPKKYVEVQGHTDTQPVVNQVFVDNWALASARSDNVVRYLSDQGAITSSHLKSTSCSEYRRPEAGQKMDRRVEMVLSLRP